MAKNNKTNTEPDSVFFLKVLLFFIVGSIWLKLENNALAGISAVPIGLPIGIMFASHDHFVIDRKIEYTILLVSTVISYFLPVGIVL